MFPREIRAIPDLDLDMPEFAPRSRLFGLEPIGLGTARAEGLISYLVRLARAHSVSPRRMVRTEFPTVEPEIARMNYSSFFTRDVGTANGLGKHARVFSKAVNKLTGIQGAEPMTLLPLAELLPVHGAGLLSPHPKWCPVCLKEMAEVRQESHFPLAWYFRLYSTCPIHRCSLEHLCPSCGRKQPFIPRYPDASRCEYCGCFLGFVQDAKPVSPTDSRTVHMDLWKSAAIEDIVLNLSAMAGKGAREAFLSFLERSVLSLAGGNRSFFCRQIGLPERALKGWFVQAERPSFPQFLSLCYGLGIMPSRVFVLEAAPLSITEVTEALLTRAGRPLWDVRQRMSVKGELDLIVANLSDTRSIAEVGKALGVGRTFLKYWFPEHYFVIAAKHSESRARKGDCRRQEQVEILNRVMEEMLERGEYPGRRKVDAALRTKGVSLVDPRLREEYRRILAILRITVNVATDNGSENRHPLKTEGRHPILNKPAE